MRIPTGDVVRFAVLGAFLPIGGSGYGDPWGAARSSVAQPSVSAEVRLP